LKSGLRTARIWKIIDLEDYRRAINANTRLIMRVHPSNYRIVGFASTPEVAELAALAHEHNLPLYEDGGSGVLSDVSGYGVIDEPTVSEIVAAGADVVSFSGDKLLGSAQAGLIVGKQPLLDRLRKHPLYRALRSDKLRLAALEATLVAHQRDKAASEVPVLQMLSLTAREIEQRARQVIEQVRPTDLGMDLGAGVAAVGGGTAPTSNIPSTVIALSHPRKSASQLEQQLRSSLPPVIARIAEDKVLLDLRTVAPEDLPSLITALKTID
jgi:L-seryl-tRNA(Ser) seleniumtransferase